ncbi:Protein CMSS1 OS=Danio rerio GN=cmss1 PE=2 SV=1 [Rhizoctonia solani AG-1 IB]|uniref:Protein CMSS1 n=1 Tax=Thanatephorus cucumeris (strain AG1-IB / isolate 7/3/14) TaxID=1108050 RepID=A0A0B7F8A6_THACB|nr:Protein CMSS1 OS=Danio rerio GN=cmss1 PE=2 SV=1 [Rhizoctonia solani AG-1 IB]
MTNSDNNRRYTATHVTPRGPASQFIKQPHSIWSGPIYRVRPSPWLAATISTMDSFLNLPSSPTLVTTVRPYLCHSMKNPSSVWSVTPPPVASKKRKRPENSPVEPKQKKQKPVQDAPRTTMCQPPDALGQHLGRSLAKAFPKMSQLERDDLVIPESSIVDTTTFTLERTDSSLSEFITSTCPTLASRIAQRPKHHAAPTAIVLAGAALRVADLTRAIRPLKGESGGEIAKLFAKHFKLKDHVAHLAKTRVGVAVGTPARISQLLAEPDALSVKALSHIVLDLTFVDTKQRSLLDIPETRVDTLRGVLGHSRIRERLLNGKTKIVVF